MLEERELKASLNSVQGPSPALDFRRFPPRQAARVDGSVERYSVWTQHAARVGLKRRVVTIARSFGAGGEEVGEAVAASLGFQLVDREILVRAAQQAGVSPEAVEETEHRRPLLLRIVEAMAVSDPDVIGWDPAWAMRDSLCAPYKSFICDAIQAVANEGDVVIVGHGAGHVLTGMKSCLRVFVTGSKEVRAKRLGLDARCAKKAIEESDRERADFLHRFYGIHEESPTHYDLVVNTDDIDVAEAARLIAAMAYAPACESVTQPMFPLA
jgi:cytidylate kinase